jgi:hypothetical protein
MKALAMGPSRLSRTSTDCGERPFEARGESVG